MTGTQKDSDKDLPPWVAGVENRMDELNPRLDEDQISIIAGYGEELSYRDGDAIWGAGDRDAGLVLVLEGELEIVDKSGDNERVIITHGRGHYGGEIVTMAGRGALVGGRARGETKVIRVGTEKLKELLALEAELGEILLTSFIVRRMRMIAEDQGEVVLYGIKEEAETARIRTFLSRQGVPHVLEEISTVEDLPSSVECDDPDLPVLKIGTSVLCKPTVREVAEKLNLAAQIENGEHYDVAIIGAGPAGLAAAVYGASEGLKTIVLESLVPGGQAGTSSRIENYLGFPTGISGQGLAGRAFLQATKFGAEIAIAREAIRLECEDEHVIRLDGDDTVKASAVIIATGAIYREPPIENLEKFTGGGVHYGASYLEAQLCRQKNVAVVGGGNSAGQAAIYLSNYAKSVKILIRSEDLTDSMSSYLIDRIEKAPNIDVVPHTEVKTANGDVKLQSLTLKNRKSDKIETVEFAHLFVFIGAVPASDFVPDAIELDDKGFVLTGDSLRFTSEQAEQNGWPRDTMPFHLETSCPGVFAIGDIRSGSVKRVASAVGEGSVCISGVHRHLEQLNSETR